MGIEVFPPSRCAKESLAVRERSLARKIRTNTLKQRSPVHKRAKIPVRTEAEQMQLEFERFSKRVESNINFNIEKNLAKAHLKFYDKG